MNTKQTRPQILIIASRVPFPPIGGDLLKNLNLIKKLSQTNDIHLICLSQIKQSVTTLQELSPFCKSLKIIHTPKWKCLLNAFIGLFQSDPIQVAYYYHRSAQDAIDRIVPEVDCCIATLVRTAKYLSDRDIPKVLDIADSLGLSYLNSQKNTASPFWKLLYWLEAKRLIAFEEACIKAFNKTLFFNETERDYFSHLGRTSWIPHGINENLFTVISRSGEKRAVAFLGKMDYQPNIDAVVWFCKKVLPLLPGDIEFLVAGAAPTPQIRALAQFDSRVKVTGFLEDPYSILSQCISLIAPMQTGAGIQNKVLEALAIGLPVITTPRAAKPIKGAQAGVHLLVETEPEGFAKAILALAEQPELRNSLSVAGRQLVQSTFTWEHYEQTMQQAIREAMDASAR